MDTITNASTIREWLIAQGWKRYANGYEDKHGDRYLDLADPDWGWVLNGFSDGDINGVATGHWVMLAEGDTLAELQEVLQK